MTCVRPVTWMQSRRTQNLHLLKALPAAGYGHAKQFAYGEQHHYCAEVRRITCCLCTVV